MSISTPLYNQLLSLLSQHSKYRDLRHLKALSWMINALILSSKINLSEWESYVISRAKQAQSLEAARTRRPPLGGWEAKLPPHTVDVHF